MFRRICVVLAAGVLFLAAGQVSADITNGDFSAGLTGWTTAGPVSDGGGYALFEEDPLFGVTSLEQEITIPAQALSLSFDYGLFSTPDGTSGYPLPDRFSAYLLDAVTRNPLLSRPGLTDYFFEDRRGFGAFDSTIVTVAGGTVTLDLTSIAAGTDALVTFDLLGGDDGFATQATVDNVSVSLIPVPGAALLGVVGLASAGYRLRRRNRNA